MKKNEFITFGMALFAMFFGAGNLIFPPSIGLAVGDNWLIGMVGFFVTGVGLPLLGILAFNKAGSLLNFANKVSKRFSLAYCSFLILALGPLLAIPRTGATTYEMGIVPLFGTINPLFVSTIYFGITLLLVLNPSKVIDMISKVLTPIILLMLFIIIIKGIISPIGYTSTTIIDSSFSFGFLGGYQTMDTLGSILMGAVIMNSIISKGYKDREDQKKIIKKASIVAGIGLASVYGGLLYLGATTSSLNLEVSNTELMSFIGEALLGSYGSLALGICVSAACLTTSIGLVTIVGEYFSKFNKLTYKQIVTGTCIFSALMAVIGVDAIMKVAVPILIVLYPITIILIFLNIFDIEDSFIYKSTVSIALLFGLLEVTHTQFNIEVLSNVFLILPLAEKGFVWLLPTLIVGLYAIFRGKVKEVKVIINQ